MSTNWNDTYEPNSVIAVRFARSTDATRKIPNRISGCRTRSSRTTNAASSTPSITNPRTVGSEPQPAPGAETTV